MFTLKDFELNTPINTKERTFNFKNTWRKSDNIQTSITGQIPILA